MRQIPGTSARQGQSRIEALKGQAFLSAREALKGGGQITDFESKRAEAAMARLQDPGIGEKEYRTALKEFHDSILSGMNKLKQQPGMEGFKVPPPIDFKPGANPRAANPTPEATQDPLGIR
jgi:hypothetical protein